MSRLPEPALTDEQARLFRKKFRDWRKFYGATNENIGAAIDRYSDDLGARGDGTRAVTSALAGSRTRLTHRAVRRLFVALLLSRPARAWWKKLHRMDGLLCDPIYEGGMSLLSYLGAISFVRPPAVPVFLPLAAVDELARKCTFALFRRSRLGTEVKERKARLLARALREEAPEMTRAWCDAAQKSIRTSRESFYLHLRAYIEALAQEAMGLSYIGPAQAPPMDRELVLLDRVRPSLSRYHAAIPIFQSEDN